MKSQLGTSLPSLFDRVAPPDVRGRSTKTLSHKLFEMVGSAWILDLLNISDHFAI